MIELKKQTAKKIIAKDPVAGKDREELLKKLTDNQGVFVSWSASPVFKDGKRVMVPDYRQLNVSVATLKENGEKEYTKVVSICGFNNPVKTPDGNYTATPMSEAEKKFINLAAIRYLFEKHPELMVDVTNKIPDNRKGMQKYPRIFYSSVSKILNREARALAHKGETLFKEFETTKEALHKNTMEADAFVSKQGDFFVVLYTPEEKLYGINTKHVLQVPKTFLDKNEITLTNDKKALGSFLASEEFSKLLDGVNVAFKDVYNDYNKFANETHMSLIYTAHPKELELVLDDVALEHPAAKPEKPEVKIAR